VTAGQSCNFVGGTIKGNVKVGSGGSLTLSNSEVLGDIDADEAEDDVILNSILYGNVSDEGAPLNLAGSEVDGNVSVNGLGDIPMPIDMSTAYGDPPR
jgi:hypothetical protein